LRDVSFDARNRRYRRRVSSEISVLRLDFGYFVRPAEESGSTAPRVEPVLGYVVQHPKGTVLLDSGMGSHPDVDATATTTWPRSTTRS